ncbi:MAG: adenylyl-sulfate kinase [Streptomycetaceae bacterium]|nr:adenylyl-sulfate kinase [Streptomycetaceae bacterium]
MTGRVAGQSTGPRNIRWHTGAVARADRLGLGATVWFTGLSGSGKSTVAVEVERLLTARGVAAYRLDGDNLRHGLNADLGFGDAHRGENIRRVGEVAKLFADAGVVALVPVISPFRADRARVRALHTAAGLPFWEVYVATPLAECERRDPKGLYARARAGTVASFTGISAPYEPPADPELTLGDTPGEPPARLADRVVQALAETLQARRG